MTKLSFRVIAGKTIHRIIHADVPRCVSVVRDAYLTHGAGDSINPNSYFLRFPAKPRDRIIALPAYLGGATNVAGIKWISSFPENVTKGLPRASAALILNDYETGYPFACLEASIVSAARTAASAVLGAEAIHRSKRAESLTIVGTGLIARYVYRFLLAQGWEIGTVRLHDLERADAERFRDKVCEPARHRTIEAVGELAPALAPSDLVLFATTTATPYVPSASMFRRGATVLHLSLRDLSPEVILSVQNVVDDVGHVMNAETSPHLAEKLTGGRAFVNGTLAELLNQHFTLDRERTTVFSPFGLGVLDLAVGRWVFDAAVAADEAVQLDDFFYDLDR